jgi:hypothetical protein
MGCEMLLAGAWSHGSVRNKERHGRWRCVPPMSGMRVARGERRRLEPKPLNFANEVEELVNVDRLGDKTVCVTVLIFWIPMLWSTLTTPRRPESSASLRSCEHWPVTRKPPKNRLKACSTLRGRSPGGTLPAQRQNDRRHLERQFLVHGENRHRFRVHHFGAVIPGLQAKP